ncbi:hypothetical protein COU78_04740 [Candidatus Peregrinibacteria bacterium CG10_big_fil_rev_8_21_14_0_10_49_24]|nr:MAG: hypothetical protein COV83_03885 [Candidatus Peregrinibacteria bacterium CG11_big_fil_rev_8_21_14_0_20_49_14]PIR50658.1 MAG: hypothetical protein COU78_04740 [Candidatus Peregrinibacteria bacterium CG10_big_fil_rev_8_21_14_0_10_49_24]PJA67742.1 MAG: hypothetical protein CO157_03030 [Candidatus Peregrinibacteria bacterium CG_4_9_14_3_um_filter_49_12]
MSDKREQFPVIQTGGTIDSASGTGGSRDDAPGGTIDGRTGKPVHPDSSQLPTDSVVNMAKAMRAMRGQDKLGDLPVIIEHGTDVLDGDTEE